MRVLMIACSLVAAYPSAAFARSSQWWFVTAGSDKVLFVDTQSIVREGDIVRYEASQVLRDPVNPAASLRASMTGNCREHTETWDLVLRYGKDDERLDESAISYGGPQRVEAGSVGEAQLAFVCAANRELAGGFAMAIDQVAFAQALMDQSDAHETPAALHDRMRADPKVPVIRSTAPPPETFGTPQRTRTGNAVVPPRDYAKGLQVPDARNYDTAEIGIIYDIAYLGIEDGQMAFELRGYGIDDLVHPGSGQMMRFAPDQKSLRINDIAIEVLAATPQDLRFKASLAPKDTGDEPFTCADPACSAP